MKEAANSMQATILKLREGCDAQSLKRDVHSMVLQGRDARIGESF